MAANKSLTFNIFGKDKTASKSLRGVGSATGALQKQFLRLGAVIGGVFALKRVVAFGKASVVEFAKAEEGQNRLTDAYARFPSVANVNIAVLRKLNTTLQNKTKFDDDALAAAQAQLAQYKLSGKQIEKLTPLLADFAAKTGQDLPSAASTLGKALLGQGRGLKAIGVNFKDAGSVTANYAQLIDILTDKVGGFAEKEGQTFSGQLAILTNQTGELKEKIGGVLAPALGHLVGLMSTRVLPIFDGLVTKIGPKLSKFFENTAQHVGDFLEVFSHGATTGDWGPLTDFLKELGPVLPVVVAGVGALGAALSDPEVQDSLKTLVVEGLPVLVDLLVALAPLIPILAGALRSSLVPALSDTTSMFGAIGDVIDLVTGKKPFSALLADLRKAQGPWADGVKALTGVFLGAQGIMVDAANGLIGAIEAVINAVAVLTNSGATVRLPRISKVTGYGAIGTSGSTAVVGKPLTGGATQRNGGGGSRPTNVAALMTGGGTTVNVNITGVVASTKQQLAQAVYGVLVDGRRTGSIPAGSF